MLINTKELAVVVELQEVDMVEVDKLVGEEMEDILLRQASMLKVVVEVVMYITMMPVVGEILVVEMQVIILDIKDLVEVVIATVMTKLVDLVEEEEVVVIDLTIHRMLEVVEVALYKYNILEHQEVQVVTIGAV